MINERQVKIENYNKECLVSVIVIVLTLVLNVALTPCELSESMSTTHIIAVLDCKSLENEERSDKFMGNCITICAGKMKHRKTARRMDNTIL